MEWIGHAATATNVLAAVLSLGMLYRQPNWRWVLVTGALTLVMVGRLIQVIGNPALSIAGLPVSVLDLNDLLLGAASCFAVVLIGRAVTERFATFRQSEARLRQIIDLVPHMIFAKDWDSRFLLANKALADAYGKRTDELIGKIQADFQLSREELEHFLADDRAVMTSGQPKFIPEEPFTDQDGQVRVLETTKIPFTASGTPERAILGVAVDITERKRATEGLRRTLRELDHRVKNTLAMVQAMAEQAAAGAESLDDFLASFRNRVRAMARVHDALREKAWHGVGLRTLVAETISPYRGDRESVVVTGPDVLVPAGRVQALGMALHELVANAARHGALSRPDGQIHVDWDVAPGPAGTVVRLEWRESNGPPVSAPSRRGLGLKIIEEGLRYEAEADAEVWFDPTGVRACITMPLAEPPSPAATGEAPA